MHTASLTQLSADVQGSPTEVRRARLDNEGTCPLPVRGRAGVSVVSADAKVLPPHLPLTAPSASRTFHAVSFLCLLAYTLFSSLVHLENYEKVNLAKASGADVRE